MDRRNFLKLSSVAVLSTAGSLTGISKVIADGTSESENVDKDINEVSSGSIERRKLGGMEVSAIGLGCLPMVGYYGGKYEKKDMISLIRHAYDMGFGFGVEEGKPTALNSRPDHIRRAVEGSLKRLRTDYIDLLYQHRVDPEVPMEEVAGVVKDLMREGKVLNWGLSEASARSIRKAHSVCPLSAVQSEYAIWWREPETKIFPTLEELGIGFVPYCPLGRAFLTGVINENSTFHKGDRRWNLPQFTPEALKHNSSFASTQIM